MGVPCGEYSWSWGGEAYSWVGLMQGVSTAIHLPTSLSQPVTSSHREAAALAIPTGQWAHCGPRGCGLEAPHLLSSF